MVVPPPKRACSLYESRAVDIAVPGTLHDVSEYRVGSMNRNPDPAHAARRASTQVMASEVRRAGGFNHSPLDGAPPPIELAPQAPAVEDQVRAAGQRPQPVEDLDAERR